jgi:glycolate oxidase FAD binding subunit
MLLTPATPEELSAAIQGHPCVLPIGARTKPRLTEVPGDAQLISTSRLNGIASYDPSEFTFTALAGTPLRDIVAALEKEGQYLPWDPPLLASGATLGGTIAAGLSGPGRFRFGGLRDFILAVRFADGQGRLFHTGAKVVKNAAGFDVPKFLVGSLGRYGVIVEATLKVFPRPAARVTVSVPCAGAEQAVLRLAHAANARWELEALDYEVSTSQLMIRLGGPGESNAALVAELVAQWPEATVLPAAEAEFYWDDDREFRWAGPILAKLPLSLGQVSPFLAELAKIPDAKARLSAGGDLAWISLPSSAAAHELSEILQRLSLTALVLRGDAPLWLGKHQRSAIADRVRRVFDPEQRFAPA